MKRRSSMTFALVLVLTLVLIMAGPMASPVQADSSGPNDGDVAENDNSVGTEAWGSAGNALLQDNTYANVLLQESGNTSQYLKVTDFDFNIPSTATIEGIKVEVDRYESPTPLRVSDYSIRLVKGGDIDGDNRSEGAQWPSSDTDEYASYGNSTDLWGLTWEPADINSSGFGAAISAVLDGSSARNAWVDHVRITVYYSVDVYHLTMAANPGAGGTAIDDTGASPYEEGEEVNIRAEAATGYWFVEWTADPPTPGGFADSENDETIFTMPAYNVTVTASFSDVIPPPTYPTVTTRTATQVKKTTAYLNSDYTLGTWGFVSLRFAYRETGDISWLYTDWVVRASGDSFFEVVSGLTSDTWYDFKAQILYDTTVDEGATLQFQTDPDVGPDCPIALAAHGTPTAGRIDVLREFRDGVLLEGVAGSQFVSLYYELSPPVADVLAGNELLRTLVRELLIDPIVCIVEATGNIWRY